MRKVLSALVGLTMTLAFTAFAQQSQQSSNFAAAVRKAQEAKKNTPKAKGVYTNDNIPREAGGVSVVGTPSTAAAPSGSKGAAATEESKGEGKKGLDEAEWRKKFQDARNNLATAEKELDILQRELNLNQQQYYSNPSQALREQYSRGEINDQRAKIEAKKQEVAQLKQKFADLEDDLRKAGGPPAWARP